MLLPRHHTFFKEFSWSSSFDTRIRCGNVDIMVHSEVCWWIYTLHLKDLKLTYTFFQAGWQFAGWIFLRSLPSDSGRAIKYLAAVIVASWPSTHPLNIAWMSENTGWAVDLYQINRQRISESSVDQEHWKTHCRIRPRHRSMYVLNCTLHYLFRCCSFFLRSANIYGVWGSQIYRADDAPEFRRGNLVNILFAGTAFILWFAQKNLYRWRNSRNTYRRSQLSETQLEQEEHLREKKGNESPLFTFTT